MDQRRGGRHTRAGKGKLGGRCRNARARQDGTLEAGADALSGWVSSRHPGG